MHVLQVSPLSVPSLSVKFPLILQSLTFLLGLTITQTSQSHVLNNIGSLYNDLGEKQKALIYFNQALPLQRSVEDRRGEAITLGNMGTDYSDLGEEQKALDYYSQALN